jgi:hypothetical protein
MRHDEGRWAERKEMEGGAAGGGIGRRRGESGVGERLRRGNERESWR